MEEGRLLPLVDIHDRSFQLHEQNLLSVVEQAGDRRVEIINITGTSVSWRSLFRFFLVFDLKSSSPNADDSIDHDSPKDQPAQVDTPGIYIWNRPFILGPPEAQLAVVILETHHTHEENYNDLTSPRSLSALSFLLSSFVIFNEVYTSTEETLKSLEGFVVKTLSSLNDGHLVKSPISATSIFQRFLFIIKDWSEPRSHRYGTDGGNRFFGQSTKSSTAAKNAKSLLTQYFDRVDCFLLPTTSEGSASCVADTTGFGDIFADVLSQLMDHINDEMPLKMLFGREIATVDIPALVQFLVNRFNDLENPLNLDDLELQTKAFSEKALISRCTEKYSEEMKKLRKGKEFWGVAQCKKSHEAGKRVARLELRIQLEGEELDDIKRMEEELMKEIGMVYDEIIEEVEFKRKKLVSQIKEEFIHSHRAEMESQFSNEDAIYTEDTIRLASLKAIDDLKLRFTTKMEEEPSFTEIEVDQLWEELKLPLRDTESKLLNKAQAKLQSVQDQMGETVDNYVSEYKANLKQIFAENPFLTEVAMSELEQNLKDELSTRFKGANPFQTKRELKPYKKALNDGFDKAYGKLKKKHQRELKKIMEVKTRVAEEAIEEYDRQIKMQLDSSGAISEENIFRRKNVKLVKSIKKEAKIKFPYTKDIPWVKEFFDKLEEDLDERLEIFISQQTAQKASCESSYKEAVRVALDEYQKDLREFLEETKFCPENLVQEKHEKLKTQALSTYTAKDKLGVHLNPEVFSDELNQSIQAFYEQTLIQYTTLKETLTLKAKNFANDCQQQYEDILFKKTDLVQDMDSLERIHTMTLSNTVADFQGLTNGLFPEDTLDNLISSMNRYFEEEIKEYFQLKSNERKGAIRNLISETQKLYKEEMDKQFLNRHFIQQDELEELHTAVSIMAIDRCKEKNSTILSDVQVSELNSALSTTFKAYQERNHMNTPVTPAIGIDLGTTYSCMGVYLQGKIHIIPNAQGFNTTPSYVTYNSVGRVDSVGEPSKRKAFENAEDTIFDAKRIIGRKFYDPTLQQEMKMWPFEVIEEECVPKIKLSNGRTLDPEQVSAEVLRELRSVAESFLNCAVENAVITVPAYFTDGQRQATIDAGKCAGLNVLKVLNEPTAAAIAYKLQYTDDVSRNVLVYDLGGGTFDVALLKMSEGHIDTVAVDGDTHLGGEDFDQNVMKYCVEQFKARHGKDLMEGKDSADAKEKETTRRRLKRLQQQCELAKIMLAACRTTEVVVDSIWNDGTQSLDLKVELTRAKFEELNDQLFKKSISVVERLLTETQIEKGSIDDIVLIGGSTKIPKVQAMLSAFFGGKALNKKVNQDEAVAYGAAMHAAILNGKITQSSSQYLSIKDVTPMAIGVEVYGGDFSIIIPKSTKIPTRIKEQYRTAHNNQTSVQIVIYQGEHTKAQDNEKLGEFYLNGVPPAEAGRETIDVTMEINMQGILQITAVCTSVGESNSISVVENKFRMSSAKIQRILDEANAHRSASTSG